MNLLEGFFAAWLNLMNLFDYDLVNMAGHNYQSSSI